MRPRSSTIIPLNFRGPTRNVTRPPTRSAERRKVLACITDSYHGGDVCEESVHGEIVSILRIVGGRNDCGRQARAVSASSLSRGPKREEVQRGGVLDFGCALG